MAGSRELLEVRPGDGAALDLHAHPTPERLCLGTVPTQKGSPESLDVYLLIRKILHI